MADDGGLSSFQRRMQAIPAAARQAVRPAVMKGAVEVSDLMRQLAESSRDTGALIDSIEITGPGETTPAYSQPGGATKVPENAVAITAGNTDVRYAHLVEFGTNQISAQPFFWPAVRLLRKRTTNRIKRAISKAMREAK